MDFHEGLDEIADTYHLTQQPDDYIEEAYQDHEIEWLLKYAKGRKRILDLGLGDGRIYRALRQMAISENSEIHIVDASLALISKHQIPQSDIFFHHSLFESFESELHFDLIIASHVLEHVSEPSVLISKLADLLASRGLLLVVVPNADSLHRQLAVEIGVQEKKSDLSARDRLVGHLRVYDLPWLRREFAHSGLTIVEERGFFVKPFSNAQLMGFSTEIIQGLIRLGDHVPANLCANIALVLTKD